MTQRVVTFWVGVGLVLVGLGTHIYLTRLLGERITIDVVSLVPALLGAHLVSRGFLRQLVAAVKARWGTQ